MTAVPLELTARDLDAYSPEKASSNAFSRPRLEVKQRALAWSRAVAARLAALGIAVEVHASDEHPCLRNKKRVDCQWVFFWRDAAAREVVEKLLDQGRSMSAAIDDPNPASRHAFLALRIDADRVEVGLTVPPDAKVDVDNLRALLDDASVGALVSTLAALPNEFAVGVGAPASRGAVACGTASPADLRALVARADAEQAPLWFGWSVPRETALAHAAILDEQLEDAIVALAPVYQLVAWGRDNDRIAIDQRLAGAREERARAHAEVEAENERWRAERALERERSIEHARARFAEGAAAAPAAPRRPTLTTLFGDAKRAGPPPTAPSSPVAAPTPAPEQASEPQRASAPAIIEKGARVRVRSGPFADKVGMVAEVDGRGARVLLGLLSSRFELSDLEPVVEGRPALQSAKGDHVLRSSHRRPLGAVAPTRKARG